MENSRSDAYAAAGVDITAGYKAVELMIHSLIDICHSASSDFSYNLIAFGYDHSRLQHVFTSFVNGSTSTIAILSLPPF